MTPRQKTMSNVSELKLVYTDESHTYYLNGKRAKSVTNVAKIPVDSFTLEQWDRRQVAIGMAIDPNLVEKVAVDIENRDTINKVVEDAKKTARAHLSADRGTQMHRVLELVLLDQEEKLLTAQQRADAVVLKRTLDRYKLTPYDALIEQFVAWPQYCVTGRFDAVLETSDGALILVDLKSGPNAVTYPQATAIQLALYARAPHISDNIDVRGDKSTITDWRTMPERLDRHYGYVLLVEPDAEVGTLHEIDIEHGWAAAQLALQIVNWRKELNYGKNIAHEVLELDGVPACPNCGGSLEACEGACYDIPTVTELISRAQDSPTLEHLRTLWNTARDNRMLTPIFRVEAAKRSKKLMEGAA